MILNCMICLRKIYRDTHNGVCSHCWDKFTIEDNKK